MKCLGFDHIEINVSRLEDSADFYDKFLGYLGYKRHKGEPKDACGYYLSGEKGQLWIVQTKEKDTRDFHRKRVGLNHLAFRASSREDVDIFVEDFLIPSEIPVLYGGAKEYPEYYKGYYAAFFEDPDRVKLEVMWLDDK